MRKHLICDSGRAGGRCAVVFAAACLSGAAAFTGFCGEAESVDFKLDEIVEKELAAVSGDVAGSDSALAAALQKKQAELEAAKREIEHLKDIVRRIAQTNRHERFVMCYNMGCVYKAAGEYKKAESQFLKALELDPSDAALRFNLGILYDDDLQDKKKARVHYLKFIELAPDDDEAPRVREWLASLVIPK